MSLLPVGELRADVEEGPFPLSHGEQAKDEAGAIGGGCAAGRGENGCHKDPWASGEVGLGRRRGGEAGGAAFWRRFPAAGSPSCRSPWLRRIWCASWPSRVLSISSPVDAVQAWKCTARGRRMQRYQQIFFLILTRHSVSAARNIPTWYICSQTCCHPVVVCPFAMPDDARRTEALGRRLGEPLRPPLAHHLLYDSRANFFLCGRDDWHATFERKANISLETVATFLSPFLILAAHE